MKNKIYNNIDLSLNSDLVKQELKEKVDHFFSLDLPIIFTEEQLKELFFIDSFFNTIDNSNMYEIEKKDKLKRKIYQPYKKLKSIQSWILKNILDKIEAAPNVHAFTKKKSILTNAKTHYYEGEEFWLLSMDLANFFDTITLESVTIMFQKIGYSKKVSSFLASLCCIEKNLVQGFPTSPAISNIVFSDIDNLFIQYCEDNNFRYSRYADDLFFSSSNLLDTKEIISLISFVSENVEQYGFRINKRKTALYDFSEVKKITGIVIREDGIFVPQKIKRMVYQHIYYCKKFGVDSHLSYLNSLDKSNFKGYLYGYGYYIKMIEPSIGKKILDELNNIFL